MADVFISYKRERETVVRRLAAALEAHGWSVWWDAALRQGEAFREEIHRELMEARAVVVLWCDLSVESAFVRDEASRALKVDALAPAFWKQVTPPLGFGEVQGVQLIDWQGGINRSLQLLIDTLERKIGPPGAPTRGTIGEAMQALASRSAPAPRSERFQQGAAATWALEEAHRQLSSAKSEAETLRTRVEELIASHDAAERAKSEWRDMFDQLNTIKADRERVYAERAAMEKEAGELKGRLDDIIALRERVESGRRHSLSKALEQLAGLPDRSDERFKSARFAQAVTGAGENPVEGLVLMDPLFVDYGPGLELEQSIIVARFIVTAPGLKLRGKLVAHEIIHRGDLEGLIVARRASLLTRSRMSGDLWTPDLTQADGVSWFGVRASHSDRDPLCEPGLLNRLLRYGMRATEQPRPLSPDTYTWLDETDRKKRSLEALRQIIDERDD